MAFSPDERERLAGSLEEEPFSDIDEAWLEVADSGYAAYKAGKRQGIPGDRIFGEIREELGWTRN